MKLKTIVAATLLGVSSFAANATVLDTIAGTDLEFKLTGLTTENTTCLAAGPGTGCESTWGIGTINQIVNVAGFPVIEWTAGNANEYLAFFIYGISDLSITANSSNGFDILNVGATTDTGADGKIHIDIYRKTGVFAPTLNVTNRTDYDSFTGITDVGSLYLALELTPGILAGQGDNVTELYQDVNATTLTSTIEGTGLWLANVVGGSAMSKWDTNAGPGGSDFDGNFTIQPSGISAFPGLINDPAKGYAIPEPGSMALAGLGLVGLAALRRRKQA